MYIPSSSGFLLFSRTCPSSLFAITTDDSWLVAAAETIRAFASSLSAKIFVQDASWAGVLGVCCSSVISFSPPKWIHGLPKQGGKEEEELVFGCEIKASGSFVFYSLIQAKAIYINVLISLLGLLLAVILLHILIRPFTNEHTA